MPVRVRTPTHTTRPDYSGQPGEQDAVSERGASPRTLRSCSDVICPQHSAHGAPVPPLSRQAASSRLLGHARRPLQ